MLSFRFLSKSFLALLVCWLAFVAVQYTQYRLQMRDIANGLFMENRTFHLLSGPLDPSSAVDGEERLLVVGESGRDFLLCSIVRNPLYSDWRGQWKVDACFRPDLQPDDPRLPVWQPMDHFPTESDLDQFRSDALKQPWVRWDSANGTNPGQENGT